MCCGGARPSSTISRCAGGCSTPRFPDLQYLDADDAPAGASATTLLRDRSGGIEVRDAMVSRGTGLALVRLLRRHPMPPGVIGDPVVRELRLGGFDAPAVDWQVKDGAGTGTLAWPSQSRSLRVHGGAHELTPTTRRTP